MAGGSRLLRARIAIAGLLAFALAATCAAQPASPHHGFLGGPWEILAKLGHEGQALRLPLTVVDESKPQALDAVLPVMGTPLKVKALRYLPDLKWETIAVDDPNGGAVAHVSLRGERLKQDLWLSASDVSKQSILSHVGGVTMRELPGGPGSAAIIPELTKSDVVGVLLLWLGESKVPLQYPVKPGESTQLPGTQWNLSVLRYLPHYSVDRESKEVANLSDQPVNPAVELQVQSDGEEFRQWVWSRFPSSPHKRLQLPFRAQFVDFPVGTEVGQHVLIAARDMQPRLLALKDGKRVLESVEYGKRIPFGDERYSFAVEEVRFSAAVKTQWTNNSDMLLHPAVVATIVQGDAAAEAVLELNKPFHHRTKSGTLVVLYRRVP
jgi:hypothetical protein